MDKNMKKARSYLRKRAHERELARGGSKQLREMMKLAKLLQSVKEEGGKDEKDSR